MANTKSTVKRIRQAEAGRQRNRALRSEMRTTVKRLRTAIETADSETARSLLPDALSQVDRAARKNGIHGNAAARTKSRLTRAVRSLSSD